MHFSGHKDKRLQGPDAASPIITPEDNCLLENVSQFTAAIQRQEDRDFNPIPDQPLRFIVCQAPKDIAGIQYLKVLQE